MTLAWTQTLKIVYIGQAGPLSSIPLEHLCHQGIRPEAVVVPSHTELPKGLNLLPVQPAPIEGSLAKIALEHDLLLIEWYTSCEAEIRAKLVDISPDLVIMSCFPWRIPEDFLNIPTLGWWNLHPSLLPAYRGPTPLFWQARAGEVNAGISLHQVEPMLDSGAILGQSSVLMADFKGKELEVELASQGAKLIEIALLELKQAKLLPRAQEDDEASYQGFPDQQDRCIEIVGKASTAYYFIRQMNSLYSLWFEIDQKKMNVVAEVSFDDQATIEKAYKINGEQLTLQFEQGVLVVNVKEE